MSARMPVREVELPSATSAPPSGAGWRSNREELLAKVRAQNPELQVEDAFDVPQWFSQQKGWFENPALANSVAYHYPLLIRLRGPLNENAMRQSLRELVRRHGVFRSVFRILDEKLIQMVKAPQDFDLPILPLGGSAEEIEQQVQEVARREALRPFDLARGPMLRAQLLRLPADDYFLQLTTQTLIYDDWSSGVLIRELSEIYGAFAAGTSPAAPSLPFQYGDFIRWQHERLQGPEFDEHLGFWKEQLDSATAFEHLPVDFARPAHSAHTGALLTEILPGPLADSLKALCRQERVSLFMLLLAGFKCLLHRYSGHEEIGVATCAANRSLVEVEGLIGRFGNCMLLRSSLSGNPTFSELLKRVREVTMIASSHLEVPFGMLAERQQKRNLPIQVMFIFQNAPKESWQLPQLQVDWASLDTGTSKQALTVYLKSTPALEITLEYDTELFTSASMSKLLADYQTILEIMVKNPHERIGNVPILLKTSQPDAKPAATPANGMVDALQRPESKTLENSSAPPPDSVEKTLERIWCELLGVEHIAGDDDYFSLGGDSLTAARLVVRVNAAFGVTIFLRTLLECPTLNTMAEFIKTAGRGQRHNQSGQGLRGSGTGTPLFYIPGIWGYEFLPGPLAGHLGKTCRYFDALQYPGLDGREPLPTRVEDVAAYLIPQIRSIWPDGPYQLVGWSFGGLMAFEIARQMTAQGLKVETVFLLDSATPKMPRRKRTKFEILKIIRHRWSAAKGRERLSLLGELAFKSVWLMTSQEKRDARVMVAPKSSPMRDAVLRVEPHYRPAAYAGKVVLIQGENSKWFGMLHEPDAALGWKKFVPNLETLYVPGNHQTMFQGKGVSMIAQQILQRIPDRP
jgi:thioesterase domain-containing protein/acyl carrier protein